MIRDEPVILSYFGGPGCGKSTCAAGAFYKLKRKGASTELAHEFAKDLTWEKRWTALGQQPYIAGEQTFRYDRLRGQVDIIVTDSSPLLGCIYGTEKNGVTPAFREWLLDDWHRRLTVNILIERPLMPYESRGRRESEESARCVDGRIKDMLLDAGVHFHSVPLHEAVDYGIELAQAAACV